LVGEELGDGEPVGLHPVAVRERSEGLDPGSLRFLAGGEPTLGLLPALAGAVGYVEVVGPGRSALADVVAARGHRCLPRQSIRPSAPARGGIREAGGPARRGAVAPEGLAGRNRNRSLIAPGAAATCDHPDAALRAALHSFRRPASPAGSSSLRSGRSGAHTFTG